MRTLCALAVVAVSGGVASADLVATEASITDFTNAPVDVRSPGGDGYFQVAGLGGAGGFAFSTLGAVDDLFDGAGQNIGADLIAGTHDGLAETDTFAGAGSTGTITFGITGSNGELAPAGFTVGGFAADTAGYFLGANAGGNPVDSVPAILVSSAFIELFDSSGASLLNADITGFGNFTAGAGGTWDGSLGVSFGAGSAGAGIATYVVTVNGTLVPAPASAALLGLGGLVAVRRRR